MNSSKALVVFSVVNVFFVVVDLSSTTEVKESGTSSSSDVCDKPTFTDMFGRQSRQKRSAEQGMHVIACNEDVGPPSIIIECPESTIISITKGVCLLVPSCNVDNSYVECNCNDCDKTEQWAEDCKTSSPCTITGSCESGLTRPGDTICIYAEYECSTDQSSRTHNPSRLPLPMTGRVTLTHTSAGSTEETPSQTPVIGCHKNDGSPSITIECPRSTIAITKGVCFLVPSCPGYGASLESKCVDSDETAQWDEDCKARNPCTIRGSCESGLTRDTICIYVEYECITDSDQISPTGNSKGSPRATTLPVELTPTSPGSTKGTPPQTPIHTSPSPVPSQANIVRQKTSLFRLIQERRLQNHVIETKHGLSLVECGAECNQRDDCVSFNIGNGVCELNNQVVGGTSVRSNEFLEVKGYKYYEKQ